MIPIYFKPMPDLSIHLFVLLLCNPLEILLFNLIFVQHCIFLPSFSVWFYSILLLFLSCSAAFALFDRMIFIRFPKLCTIFKISNEYFQHFPFQCEFVMPHRSKTKNEETNKISIYEWLSQLVESNHTVKYSNDKSTTMGPFVSVWVPVPRGQYPHRLAFTYIY